MKTKVYIIALIAIISLIACKEKKQDILVTKFKIDKLMKDDIFDWPGSIKIEDFIKIETNDESVLGSVKKVIFDQNRILILDNKDKSVSVFDSKGKFLNKILHQGKGPKEYIELRDFCINKQGNIISILDYKKIVKYDLNSGKHVATNKLDNDEINPLQLIQPSEHGYFLWNGNHSGNDKNCIYYWNGKSFKGLLKSNNYIVDTERFIKKWNGNYLFVPPHGNFNIYEISKESFTPKYEIDFGSLTFPKSKNVTRQNIDEIDKDMYFKRITNVQETQDWLYVLVIGPSGRYYEILINKKTKKVIAGKFNSESSFRIISSDENSFYALVEPVYILEATPKSILYSLKNIEISEFDNPLIVKFTF